MSAKKTPIVFQALAWHAEDIETDEVHEKHGPILQYVIKIFGMDAEGRKISVSVKEFPAFFCVKAEPHWHTDEIKILRSFLTRNLKYHHTRLLRSKDFWGFTDNEEFNFLRITFSSQKDMKHAISVLNRYHNISGLGQSIKIKMYESNIDPYIRFIHMNGLQPTGWIKLDRYSTSTDLLPAISDVDVEAHWKNVLPFESDAIAPFLVASFDIECTSSGGDFPMPKKDYRHIASQLYDIHKKMTSRGLTDYNKKTGLNTCLLAAIGLGPEHPEFSICRVIPKFQPKDTASEAIEAMIDEVNTILVHKAVKDKVVTALAKFFEKRPEIFPPLSGDPIIQIGTTFHSYGSKECSFRHIVTLGSCEDIEGATVETCGSEEELLLRWTKMMRKVNPDIITGYNIFGFDFEYMYHRAQELGVAQRFMKLSRFKDRTCGFKEQRLSSSALGDNFLKYVDMEGRVLCDLMKIVQRDHKLDSYKLDAVANHFMKLNKHDVSPQEIFALQKGSAADRRKIAEYCIQDCALCNYLVMKLEIVANNMGMSNVCLVPMSFIFMRGQGIKIFSLVLKECYANGYMIPVIKKDISVRKEDIEFFGSETLKASKIEDEVKRLCKLLRTEKAMDNFKPTSISAGVIATAMANLSVTSNKLIPPLSLFQGKWKWLKQADLDHVISVVQKNNDEDQVEPVSLDDDSYEGAIVLDPKTCIYVDQPVAVLDYASLYPSSMISENLSHDCIVLDPKYDNIEGVEYLDITYDLYDGKKQKIGEKHCRYVQGEKGIIPRILQKLLTARKTTRKKMTWKTYGGISGIYDEKAQTITDTAGTGTVVKVVNPTELTDTFNEFQIAVLDGLQNAYKVTANSLYGQIGAKTSPIYLKEIAACTTATGRKMIMMARDFLVDKYKADVIYGDTDSIFVTFPELKADTPHGKIMPSILASQAASAEFKKLIKKPHDLEYEKTFWPFILLSKKRYVGNLYEMDDRKFKQKSMGIVLKRRDNANIVKKIYGGIIDIILSEQDVSKSVDFLTSSLSNLIKGKYPIEDLIISKSLKAEYKDPTRIAHKVLADRIAEREPGNKPQIGDRIPYLYVSMPEPEKGVKQLQGERIETPQYTQQAGLSPDYNFYITNQIMKPILQIYALVVEQLPGFGAKPPNYYKVIARRLRQELNNEDKEKDKMSTIREMDVKQILFDPILAKIENCKIKKSLVAKKYYKDKNGQVPV